MAAAEKSVGGKSAFTGKIFAPLSGDYYLPHADLVNNLLYARLKARAPLYMALDALMMFYKPLDEGARCLRKPPQTVWQHLVSSLYRGEGEAGKRFYEVNKITRGSIELSVAAAVNFISLLIAYTRPLKRGASWSWEAPTGAAPSAEGDKALGTAKAAASAALSAALAEAAKCRETLETVQSLLAGLPGGSGFSHEALSILRFLEKPDDFRKRVQLLSALKASLALFTEALPSGEGEVVEAPYGGVDGVSQLRSIKQIVDLAQAELALPRELLALRVLSGVASVRRRATSVKPVVFVDKSGSMAASMPSSAGSVPKISAACGLALALWRKYEADVYLFDTEVHKVDPRGVLQTLLTIGADGGTRIEEVLEIASTLPPTRPVVVISDGIDSPSPSAVEKAAKRGNTVFVLIPPMGEEKWLSKFRTVRVRRLEDLVAWARAGGWRA